MITGIARNRSSWLMVAAALVLVIFIICAVFASWLTPYEPGEVNLNLKLAEPSLDHPLGCDLLGRDLLSRMIFGAQTVLVTAVSAVAISFVIGGLLGLLAGYFEGFFDAIVMRFTEAIMAIPPIILAMGIGIAMKQSRQNLMFALAFSTLPTFIRTMRGQVKSIRYRPYVKAARIIGCSEPRVIFHHVLPNCVIPEIIAATSCMGSIILAEASLSYLGVGIPAEFPAWGSMASEGFQYLDIAPRLSIFPGLAIMLTVSAFSLFGDWLGDRLRD